MTDIFIRPGVVDARDRYGRPMEVPLPSLEAEHYQAWKPSAGYECVPGCGCSASGVCKLEQNDQHDSKTLRLVLYWLAAFWAGALAVIWWVNR